MKRKTVAQRIVGGLQEFKQSLERKDLGNLTIRTIVLDLEPTPYSPELVKETRKLMGVSQALFAQFLGVSKATVSSWEQGDNKPKEIACRFMDEIRFDPKHWKKRLLGSMKERV